MFSAFGSWATGKNKKTLVERYTEELSQITGQIHDLELRLKRGQDSMDTFQYQLLYYGTALTVLVVSAIYWYYPTDKVFLCIGFGSSCMVVLFSKMMAYRMNDWLRSRQTKQLASLRSQHQKKLEKLKEETNFHATSSIIQRFSSGENHSEDAMVILDEELNNKYKEVQSLTEELDKLRHDELLGDKGERDKWFDKVVGVLAGGDNINSIPRPVICGNCKKHTGAYRLGKVPLNYVCPSCGWRVNEIPENVNSDELAEEEEEEEAKSAN